MIKKIPNYFDYYDDRGSIHGIVNFGAWEEMNYITSIAGTVRGNHYHKYTQEAFLILEGEIQVKTKDIMAPAKPVNEDVVKAGEFFIVDPFVVHTFTILKDAKWLNLLSHKMNDTDKDFFREE